MIATSTKTAASAAPANASAPRARSTGITSLAVLIAAVLLNSSCNGILVVERGPRAGELNWAGRSFCRVGILSDRVGITAPVRLDDAHPAPSHLSPDLPDICPLTTLSPESSAKGDDL